MGLLRYISDNRNPKSLAVRLRRRRFAFFESLIAGLARPLRIIDIGGTEQFWQQMGLAGDDSLELTLVNLGPCDAQTANITCVVGDGRDLSAQYEDNSFDVVFSNSVIEHVPSDDEQQRMATEMRRLAPRYFVQTPNYYFPLEPHFLVPGFQWMPERLQALLLMRFSLGWVEKQADRESALRTARSVKLLRESELRALFPGCKIERERILGLTKSLVAYGGWDT